MRLVLYKPLLYKTYFEKGFSVMNYPKYLVILAGFDAVLSRMDFVWIFFGFIFFGFVCFMIGWAWFHYHLQDTEAEILNMFNPFCKDMRDRIK